MGVGDGDGFKLLHKRFSCHAIDELNQMHIFTQGLEGQTEILLDASVRGHMKTKSEEEVKG